MELGAQFFYVRELKKKKNAKKLKKEIKKVKNLRDKNKNTWSTLNINTITVPINENKKVFSDFFFSFLMTCCF